MSMHCWCDLYKAISFSKDVVLFISIILMLTCPVTADCQAVLLHEFYLGLLEKLTTSLGHVMIVVTSHMIRRK